MTWDLHDCLLLKEGDREHCWSEHMTSLQAPPEACKRAPEPENPKHIQLQNARLNSYENPYTAPVL